MGNWQQLSDILSAAKSNELGMEKLLSLLFTQDERDAFVTRAEIFRLLLEGEMSQRQICQQLGVGIATVTRGSNELKKQSVREREELLTFFNSVLPERDEK